MTDAHQLLADVVAAAGYGAATVAQLVDATLPRQSTDELSADQALALVDAIDVTAQAGTSDCDVGPLVAALQRRFGSGWRERFWRGQLRAAAIRAARPDRYGVNPVRTVLDAGRRRPDPIERGEASTVTITTNAGNQRGEQLAARISVPVLLPRRRDGTRLDRLSASSLAMFLKCPEQWRRHYLCRERFPSTPAMALGSIVDCVVGYLVSGLIAGREPCARRELTERVDHERDVYLRSNEVAWTADEPRTMVEQLGRDAAALFAEKVIPSITDPIAVQRRFRFKLAAQATWEIVGAIDVEETRRVRDTKVKSKSIYGHDVEGDVQVSTYLLARLLEQHPAEAFVWDILLKPGKQRRSVTLSQVPARRSVGQLRATLVRYAAAARHMAALEAAFGPDEPWDFADPRHTLCSGRYCGFFPSCPGGGGLVDVIPHPVETTPAEPFVVAPPVEPRPAEDDVVLPAPPDPRRVLVDAISA